MFLYLWFFEEILVLTCLEKHELDGDKLTACYLSAVSYSAASASGVTEPIWL